MEINHVKGVLFDLDGVITDTAKFHFMAWQKMAATLNIAIDEEFNETLKGVSRLDSLRRITALGGITLTHQDEERLMAEKNATYLKYLETLSSKDILPGIMDFIRELRSRNIKIGVASVSRNAPFILTKLNLTEYIDEVANPEHVKHSKPAPDIFLEGARLIDTPPHNCIGIEDSLAGIESIRSANIRSIGVGVEGDITIATTNELSIDLLKKFE